MFERLGVGLRTAKSAVLPRALVHMFTATVCHRRPWSRAKMAIRFKKLWDAECSVSDVIMIVPIVRKHAFMGPQEA